MAGMQSVIEINRPVEVVYGFFTDLEHSIIRTDPTVESVVKTTEGPLRAGTTFRLRQPVMGKVREQTMRVIAVDPNHKIEMEAAFGPVRPQFSLTFEPTARGTRVTFRGDSRPIGPFKLVPFIMDRIGQRNWDRRLRLMKEALEGRRSMPSDGASVEIAAPREVVWDLISDPTRHTEFGTFVTEVNVVSAGPTSKGTVYRETSGPGFMKSSSEWTITEFDAPSRLVHEGREPAMHSRFTWTLEEITPASTRLSQAGDLVMMPGFRPLGWLIETIAAKRMLERETERMLQDMKRIAEAEAQLRSSDESRGT
jgi:uncharacterized protein YndB with AHSA1/START domain